MERGLSKAPAVVVVPADDEPQQQDGFTPRKEGSGVASGGALGGGLQGGALLHMLGIASGQQTRAADKWRDQALAERLALVSELASKLSVVEQSGALCALFDGKLLGAFADSDLVSVRWFRLCGKDSSSARVALSSRSNGFYQPIALDVGHVVLAEAVTSVSGALLGSAEFGPVRRDAKVAEAAARALRRHPAVVAGVRLVETSEQGQVVVSTACTACAGVLLSPPSCSSSSSSIPCDAPSTPPASEAVPAAAATAAVSAAASSCSSPPPPPLSVPASAWHDGLPRLPSLCAACGSALTIFVDVVPVGGSEAGDASAPQQSAFSFQCGMQAAEARPAVTLGPAPATAADGGGGAGQHLERGVGAGAAEGKACQVEADQGLRVVLDASDSTRLTLSKSGLALAGSILSESILLATARAQDREVLVTVLLQALGRCPQVTFACDNGRGGSAGAGAGAGASNSNAGTRPPPLAADGNTSQMSAEQLRALVDQLRLRANLATGEAEVLRQRTEAGASKLATANSALQAARARVAMLEQERGRLDEQAFQLGLRLRASEADRAAQADARSRRAEAEVSVLLAKQHAARSGADGLARALARITAAAAAAAGEVGVSLPCTAAGNAQPPSSPPKPQQQLQQQQQQQQQQQREQQQLPSSADAQQQHSVMDNVDAVELVLRQAAGMRSKLAAREAEKLDLIRENAELRQLLEGETVAEAGSSPPQPARRHSNLFGFVTKRSPTSSLEARRSSYTGHGEARGAGVGASAPGAPGSGAPGSGAPGVPGAPFPTGGMEGKASAVVQVSQLRSLANSLMETVKEKDDLLAEQRYANKVLAEKLEVAEREAARWRR
jgi:hypothetical protein